MTMKLLIMWFFGVCSLLVSSLAVSQTLKDPKERDEDLSNTVVRVKVNSLPDGNFEYIYDVESPELNKGEIDTFTLDIGCDHSFSGVVFSESPSRMFRSMSQDGKHVPIQAYGVMYHTYALAVNAYNEMVWGVEIKPGQNALGYRVISSVGPGNITYKLKPIMEPNGWNFDLYPEDDPLVPTVDDFIVTGTVVGPKCPSHVEQFLGTNKNHKEPEDVNELLSYSSPLKDRFHVKKGTKEIELTVHYSEKMDPKTFNAEPGYIKHFFNPVPGTSQTVMLPLKKNGKDSKKAKFKFEARMIGVATGKDKTKADRMKDMDEFEIRIDD
ncbi:MAG: hypothetical protein OEZ43_14440 [Gammaproteobacteria bacterium]|nr:hypothetical protein [Gammaproteobacteria bacterium]